MAKQTGTKCYDYIIAGCGGAGLSLALHMSESKRLRNKRVLLLDADERKTNDRTWCFWTDQAPPYPHIQQTSWQQVQMSRHDQLHTYGIASHPYYYTAGIDFYRMARQKLASLPNFVFQQARVEHIEDTASGVEVRTDQGAYQAKWAFSSLPVRVPKSSLTTKQHFRGWFIRTEETAFDPKAMCLMDFRTPQTDGASFFYVLPLSAQEALVEYTVISDQVLPVETYEVAMRGYIDGKLQIKKYAIEDTEQGVIPMTSYKFPRREGQHVMRIGTAGGMTKASTGFTFKNMQEDARQIVQQLELKGSPFYRQKQPARFRFYDTLLLHILKYYPAEAPRIFEKLFSSNQATRVLTFLDEKTSLAEEALMFMKLPWKPFLRSLWQHYAAPVFSRRWKPVKTPYYVPTQPEETQ
jgi:lycopene beta-cyclase